MKLNRKVPDLSLKDLRELEHSTAQTLAELTAPDENEKNYAVVIAMLIKKIHRLRAENRKLRAR